MQSFSDFNNIKRSLFINGLDQILPERLLVKLSATDNRINVTNNTQPALNFSIRSNGRSIYSGGPALTGYDSLMPFYELFRVHGMWIGVSVANLEDKAVTVVVTPTLDAHTDNSLTVGDIRDLANNPFAQQSIVQSVPSGEHYFEKFVSTRQMIGNDAYLFDDAWSGTGSSDPTKMWYWNIAAFTNTGSFTTAKGLSFDTRITMDLEYTGRFMIYEMDRKFVRYGELERFLFDESKKTFSIKE